MAFTRGNITYWRKPDGRSGGHHATTGYGAFDLLYCFSTDAKPFCAGQAYTKFAAYTLLYHSGDFHAAAKAIRQNNLL